MTSSARPRPRTPSFAEEYWKPEPEWSQVAGALTQAEAPSPSLQRLLQEVGQREQRIAFAFLLYQNNKVVLPDENPVWLAPCLYFADSQGAARYLGQATVLKKRVSLSSLCAGHGHLGPLIEDDPSITVFAIPTRWVWRVRGYDGVFIPLFPEMTNVAHNPSHATARMQARIDSVLSRVRGAPGILKTHVLGGMGAQHENILDDLEEQGLIHSEDCISKTNRPCRRFYPGPRPSSS